MVDHLPVAADFHLDILETSIDAVTDVAHLGRLKKLVTGGGDAHDRIIEQVIIVLFYLKFFAQSHADFTWRTQISLKRLITQYIVNSVELYHRLVEHIVGPARKVQTGLDRTSTRLNSSN